ncbi:TetR/AcrR family transcriptional regulator [Prolixibacteraceae bacterium Z1-6]|uniref:TetR/AcrR family transcriptional regulator n=1 Tax=Draconibacterium aestuarii TaxID=2998507 RepID=A0A9X3J5L9_9BACT|nr:TetR/AcrR family transcriptional regulator [Prolixibacteraceae bacterium Z1-6]
MEEKKRNIIKEAGRMYLKVGIRNVTMDNVATEFAISKKTLYQYFSDKEDLVSHVVDYFLEDLGKNLQKISRGNDNAIDRMFKIREHVAFILKIYNSHIEQDLEKTYPRLYKKVHETKRQRIFSGTIENLNQGIAEGLYREGLETYFIAKLQVGRLLYTLNPHFNVFEEYEVNTLAFFDSMMNYHMHAICTAKGLEYYKKQLTTVQNGDKD